MEATGSGRAAPADQVPLSYPQHLLAFLDVLHPGSAFGPSFTISGAHRITGSLDLRALGAAYADLVARHDALRSTVQAGEGVGWQRFAPAESLLGDGKPAADDRLVVVDLTERDQPDQAMEDFLDELDTRDYPADQPPLLWLFVGRIDDDDAVLVLVVHHAVADAWSMDVLIDDLAGCYRARTGQRSPEPYGGWSYARYAQADQNESGAGEDAIAYWTSALDGVPVNGFPLAYERPAEGLTSKAELRFDIPPKEAEAVAAIGRRHRASPFITSLACYLVMLNRLTGAEDLAVPTLTSGRGRRELEGTVGFFLNALVLRIGLRRDFTLAEVLESTRQSCLDAYRHEVPILRLIEEVPDAGLLLADERFGLLPFHHVPTPRATEPRPFGVDSTYRPIRRRGTRRDRGFAVPLDGLWTNQHDTDGGLSGTVTYATDLFDPQTVHVAVQGFVHVLRRLAADPATRLRDIRLG